MTCIIIFIRPSGMIYCFDEIIISSNIITTTFLLVYYKGSVYVSEHCVVIRGNDMGTVDHGKRQTVSTPYQRTGHTQRGTNVLRGRATSE